MFDWFKKRIEDVLDDVGGQANRQQNTYAKKIKKFLQSARYDAALAVAESWVEDKPKLAAAYHMRGQVHMAKGDREKALADYAKALTLDPKRYPIYLHRAGLFMDAEDYQKAIDDCTQALTLAPRLREALMLRGAAYLNQGRYTMCETDLNALLEMSKQFDATVQRALMLRIDANLKTGNLEQAMNAVNRLLAHDPNDITRYYQRSQIKAMLGDESGAEEDKEAVLRHKARNAWEYNVRGAVHFERGNYETALKQFNLAIDAARKTGIPPMFFKNRGNAYLKLRRYAEALPDAKAVVKSMPQDAEVYRARGAAYAGCGKFQKAHFDFSTAIKLEPEHLYAYIQRSAVLIDDLHDYDGGIADCTYVLMQDPKNLEAYINRSIGYRHKQMYDESLADLELALEIEPGSAKAYRCRANVYVDLEQYDEAVRILEHALTLHSDAYLTRFQLVNVYYLRQQYDIALKESENVFKLGQSTGLYNLRGLA